ncbi:twin-arginine translocase subunit TatC [Corynebacterium terpenotabidum]|uniref:Sec-independent protein translocase protein TatC n=1 Tax=Corynebacterium terpenotabidum Y-11 TaxID=1200352 RepID=S4XCA0_9CORY|nr:twin-arginine translocase subunit TatC [Corynebacterium terpenotabidum]AGP30747.1 Sec-independent protein translocase protein [Corynebacterium terpenotabidum Y-11]
MPLVEHLQELRRRVLIALVAIAVGTVLGYIWYNASFLGTPSLGDILKEPYCQVPPENRLGGETGRCRLIATGPFDMFMLRLKVGFLAGLVLSAPVWFSQIWGFITPGLKKNEKRWTRGFATVATLLFVFGAVLAYFVLAYGLDFLMTMGDNVQISALNGKEYLSFALALLLIFGVSFEVPLITVMLNLAGILPYQVLKEKRRMIILVLFVFAAFITPGQDPVSMVILAVSLCVMMEIATQFARVHDKRVAKKAGLNPDSVTDDLGDDEASTIARPAPVASARPVHASSRERVLDVTGQVTSQAPGQVPGQASGQTSGTSDPTHTRYDSGDLDDVL